MENGESGAQKMKNQLKRTSEESNIDCRLSLAPDKSEFVVSYTTLFEKRIDP